MSFVEEKQEREILETMSNQDFLNFGLQDIAYLKMSDEKNKKTLCVYSADGQLVSRFEDESEFWRTIIESGVDVLSIH